MIALKIAFWVVVAALLSVARYYVLVVWATVVALLRDFLGRGVPSA